ncbi:aldehyde dehydrogenase family protein [Mycobacterium sp. NAZ190054]|uniref:aldehyde dehydrogenase family protein n=1 Tax=Mycobacterium sp. NAZ190054 TaxID=1747766 RepID=UPI0007919534|nr:aldehyde dehydrogenase family protein [Mycobacterium sp. NAZ190054]KWX68975.1 aldehyde dehydrogenase [Mycobacterium sp. NAZ190054]
MSMQTSYVGGHWVTDGGGPEVRDISPSDHADTVAVVQQATPAAVDDAVTEARRAQPGWARTSPQRRADLLEGVAARIAASADELAELLAREEGKTLAEARAEVVRASQIFRFFSGEALRITGERQASTREGVSVTLHREPIGVVGIITPWNFPIAIPAWKSAPALAFGNTVVLKPAEVVPATAIALARIIDETGFPPGVFNLVLGRGSTVGEAIVTHEGIDAVTFTGSENVGRHIAAAGAQRMIPVQLEMGGKNPLLVVADADLPSAVEVAVNGAFYQTGQRCTASSRILVESSVHDQFVEMMKARMAELRVGHALDPDTTIGPVVDENQLQTDEHYLGLARSAGGVVHGGERVERATSGNFLAPALITGLDNNATVNREEIFGPVAGVIAVDDYEQGLALANDTDFGLVAGICTTSLKYAEHFQAHADAGMVMVNLPTAGVDPHVAFGGRKRSSYGPREQGSVAREFFTHTKTAYVQP